MKECCLVLKIFHHQESLQKKIQDVIDCNDYYPPRLVAVMSVAFARPDHLAK